MSSERSETIKPLGIFPPVDDLLLHNMPTPHLVQLIAASGMFLPPALAEAMHRLEVQCLS